MRMCYLAAGPETHPECHPLLQQALEEIGTLTVITDGATRSEAERAALLRQYPICLLFRDSVPVPAALADDPGELRYVCATFGTLRGMVGPEIIASPITVTNWGDAPAGEIAEGAMALLLAELKDLHSRAARVADGGWELDGTRYGGSLDGLDVGLYGCGAIGRRFVEMLRPFNPVIRIFDPYLAELPEGCARTESLAALFRQSQAVVIHAGLTEETRGSVTAELLALLPDHGVLVNTARGGIVDQQALFAELATGRLRAALDVIEPDVPLPADHPARRWDNVLFTAHQIHQPWPTAGPPTRLRPVDRITLDNLRRFRAGEPLRFVITLEVFTRMT